MTKTFKELIEFNMIWNKWMKEDVNIVNTKIGYAINRVLRKSIQHIFDEYNLELGEIRVNHALADKSTGALITAPGTARGFQYDRDGLRAVLRAEHELDEKWNPKECSIEPYICKDENLPSDISDERREIFEGIVINKLS